MAAGNTKVVTGKVRLSYCHLFEPYANLDGQTAKYSTVILVPKSDTKTVKAIQAAQKVALENGKATKFNGSIPKNWKNTFRDGDDEDEDADERVVVADAHGPEASRLRMTFFNAYAADRELKKDAMAMFSGIYNVGIGGGALLGSLVTLHLGLSNVGIVGGLLALSGVVLCCFATYRFARPISTTVS